MSGAVAPAAREDLEVVVTNVVEQPGSVRSFTLRRADDAELPPYVPGSHVVVQCGATANAYSLTGDGAFPSEYSISVRRAGTGGGSAAMHRLRVGARLRISWPRSAFAPVANARRHLLVAGGIGVTPILSHARSAAAWHREARVLYVHRPGGGAHRGDLAALAAQGAITLKSCRGRGELWPALDRELRSSPLGTHLYVCGPEPLIDAVRARAGSFGWPDGRVHAESFGGQVLDPGERFTAVLPGGRRVPVPAGVSLLEALEAAGLDVPSLCRQGVCGQCRLGVTSGRPLHRDHYLSPAERDENRAIMACVSRSKDETLEVCL